MDHLGERNDLAAVITSCGHAYILATGAIVSDWFPIAANSAVKPTEALGLLNAFFGPGVIMGRGTKMAVGDCTTSFELTMAQKDVRLMIEAAGELPLATLPGLATRRDVLIGEGNGASDMGMMAKDAVKRAGRAG